MRTSPTISASQALDALRSILPSTETLSAFRDNDPDVAARVLAALAHFAAEHALIAEPSVDALTALLLGDVSSTVHDDGNSSASRAPQPIPAGFRFADLLDRIAAERSIKQLVRHELHPWCRRLGLPDVQESMISRLRTQFRPNTSGKLNLLRALAFWLGLSHPHWAWTFDRLLLLEHAQSSTQRFDHRHGVRLAFRIDGHGDLHEGEDLHWAHREILACLHDLEIFHVSHELVGASSTTAFVSLPKILGQVDDLADFATALRDAFALIHQMLVRWALQPQAQRSRLVVALDAGRFDQLDTPLQAMLRARLSPGDDVRVSDFVRLGAALLDLKVVFAARPRQVALYAEEQLSFWVFTSIWSHLYYPLVPAIEERLDDPLPTELDKRNQALRLAALPPPANSLVLLELAKGSLAMMRFHEATQLCAVVLASHPEHEVARTLRLIAHLNLALVLPDLRSAWLCFRQALTDAELVLGHSPLVAEEVYCELGQVHFCMARRLFVLLAAGREGEIVSALSDELDGHDTATLRRLVRDRLLLARNCFDRGRAVSASGMAHRALHWAFRVHSLLRFIDSEPNAFSLDHWPERVLTDRNNVFAQCALELLRMQGWLPLELGDGAPFGYDDFETLVGRVLDAFAHYEHSVLSKPYRANIKLAFATLSFDFMPILTVGVLKRILVWVDEADTIARSLADKPSGVKSIITCFSQVQPARLLCERAQQVRSLLLGLYASQLALPDTTVLCHGREHKFLLRSFASDEAMRGAAC